MDGFLDRTRARPAGVVREMTRLEPGLLPAFRGLVLYWLLYWLLISPVVWVVTGNPGVLEPWQYGTLIGVQGAALALLFWRAAAERLGRLYLPFVIGVTTVSFFIEKHWFLELGTAPGAGQGELLHAFAVRQDFALLLLMIAWQYRFRYAVFYVLAVSIGEGWMVVRADVPDHLGSTLNVNMLLTRAVVYLLLGSIITWLMRRQREQRRALVQANAQLSQQASVAEQLTVSRERNRLARELHDTLAHSLSALSVQLEATRALWESDPEAAKRMLEQADTTTRTGLTEARRSLQALRAGTLENLGLLGGLRDLAERAAERANLALTLALPTSLTLPPATEQGLYRVAQEALENVVRHADASTLEVRLEQRGDRLYLELKDNGTGFDPSAPDVNTRFGLRGMQERATMLAAKLTITSYPDKETHVTIELPG